ncbi:RNA metabolism protein [Lithospermum erythrorhizon]|uniref:RNA metabolism protein n=1 Tax=Lithospermum erythrorhizon TaxID=34254 RepID=A0AAV3P940_LITER
MAQAQPEGQFRAVEENIVLKHDNKHNNNNSSKNKKIEKKKKKKDNNELSSRSGFRLNAHAPEFFPGGTQQRKQGASPVPVSGYIVPCFQYAAKTGGSDQWIFVSDQDAIPLVSNANVVIPTSQSTSNNNDVLTEQLQNKIIKQWLHFPNSKSDSLNNRLNISDMSLLANENLVKQIQKDPEGFVPIAVVSSTKKLKSIISISSYHYEKYGGKSKCTIYVFVLKNASSDGIRVRRKNPFTEKEKEELQLRTVVAENLTNDHSHQNLEKIFNVAGVVQTIRVCHPQEASTRGKGDCVFSSKLHALVEFENVKSAEKAVEKLNDERNWRKSLRVRLLVRRTPKSVLQIRKSEFDGYIDEEEGHQVEAGVEDNSQVQQQSQTHQQNNAGPFSDYNNLHIPIQSFSRKAVWECAMNPFGCLSRSPLPSNKWNCGSLNSLDKATLSNLSVKGILVMVADGVELVGMTDAIIVFKSFSCCCKAATTRST